MTRSGRLLLSVVGAFTIATAGVAGAAAAPPEPSSNPPVAQAEALPTSEPVSPDLAWTVSLASSAMVVAPNTNVTLTATANQSIDPTPWSFVLLNGSTIVGLGGYGTTWSWTVTSATPASVSYTAEIAASNGSSVQAASDSVTVVWTNAPTAPSGVGAVGTHNSAVVSWTGAMSPSGPITSYTATAAPGGKTCTWTAGPLTCTITGLVDRTDYVITVTATNASGTGPPSGWGAFVTPIAGSTYHSLNPTRLLDTRNGTGSAGPFSSHVSQTFQVTGGVVPTGASAVTGNLTVTQQTSLGFLYIGAVALNNPTTSTLNFPLGDDRANAVIVPLSAGGSLSITYAAPTLGPTAHVIFDVSGYFTLDGSGATFMTTTPTRVLDTRYGTGLSGAFSSHVSRTFQVSGGVVPTGATAVSGNLTVTQQTSLGFLYIGAVAMNNPTSSTLNFPLGDDRANAVVVPLSAGGSLSITYAAPTFGPTAHVIFDVNGYFVAGTSGSAYMPLAATRILDTRSGIGMSGPSSSHVSRTFAIGGIGPIAAEALIGNLTVTQQTSRGFLYVGAVAMNDPTSSNLNFPVGDDRANAVIVRHAGGTLSVTYAAPTLGPTAHVILDVTGYFASTN